MPKKEQDFSETTGSLARAVPCGEKLVREYAKGGLIEHRKLPNGMFVFRSDAASDVRRLKAERLARCGRHPR